MRAIKSLPGARLCILMAGLFLSSFPISSWGQLNVVSIFPSDGATNVDTAVTFRIEFDAPLDTTVRFEMTESFINMFFDEDLIGDPDSIVVSTDFKTVRVFNLHLRPDTRYVFGIIGAFSTTGDPLETPVAFTFTTGDALPTGTVSGAITYPQNDPTNAVVGLFKTLFDNKPEALAVVSSIEGTYTLNYVPSDTYLVAAAKDIDQDGEISPDQGIDIIAIYNHDGDELPDKLVTAEGGTITGIDMTLVTWAPQTARQRYDEVESEARRRFPDTRLVQVVSPMVSPLGEGFMWIYLFYAVSVEEYFALVACSEIIWDWILEEDEVEEFPDTMALPTDWIDSDVAADSAEAHGGNQFRTDHPDVEVMAFLMYQDIPDREKNMVGPLFVSGKSGIRKIFEVRMRTPQPQPKAERPFGELCVGMVEIQEKRALWFYSYLSEESGEELWVGLDAQTGEFVGPQYPMPSTARFNLDVATDAASAWSPDAVPVMVGTHQSSISPTGEAEMWFYIFTSTSKDSVRAFFLSNGIFFGAWSIWEPPSRIALPDEWVDSDVVMATVEAAGGTDYRAGNDSVTVVGGLSRNHNPFEPEEAAWKIMYSSITSDPLIFYVNATTGQFITDVEPVPGDGISLPTTFKLYQNYPNPFNPETDIRYQIPAPSRSRDGIGNGRSPIHTTLKVYNILGQEVRILVNEVQEPGYYTISWDGRDQNGREVSSGVYLYRLTAGQFSTSKNMLLLR